MGRWRGCMWLTAGAVVAALAGIMAYLLLQGAIRNVNPLQAPAGEQLQVVVAARAVAVRSPLSAEDLLEKDLPADAVPEGAIRSRDQALGLVTLVDLYPGEVLLAQRLADPNVVSGDGRLALAVSQDQVLMALPAQDLMSKVGVLKPGDHVDLLFSLQLPINRGLAAAAEEGAAGAGQQQEQFTFDLLENVVIAAVVTGQTTTGGQGGAAQALLLTVKPQDALLLKYALDANGIVDIVLRPPGAEGPTASEPVDTDYLIDLYRIPTDVGR